MSASFNSYTIRKLGQNRGCPRIWLEGKFPERAGFKPQVRYDATVDTEARSLVLKIKESGSRIVSRKGNDREYAPVVDINSAQLLGMFSGLEHIRITAGPGYIEIRPLDSELRSQKRMERIRSKMENGEALSIGSLSHGGGILSKAVHDGLQDVGISAKLGFANDIREELIEQSAKVNPIWSANTKWLAAPMQELAFDPEAMRQLQECDILEAGLPCRGASLSGRAKNGISCAEEHPEVGHLVVAYLAIVARVNPAIALLENVPMYRSSASMHIIRNQLRDFGYEVHEIEVNGGDWGALEHRKRMCMVAVSKGIKFDFSDLEKPNIKPTRLGDVLEDIPLDATCWSSMDYLKKKAVSDAEQGKGFAMQILTPEVTKVGTIGAGYSKNRSTEPKLIHPTNPELLRLFTPIEHCKIKQIDSSLIEGLSPTIAHEVLGQSITPAPFRAIANLIGKSIKSIKDKFLLSNRVETEGTQVLVDKIFAKMQSNLSDHGKGMKLQASLF